MRSLASIRPFAKALVAGGATRTESVRDLFGVPGTDPCIDAVVMAIGQWILRAQACSATADGGVASHYSLLTGWGSSYPETTGYIIPSMLELARLHDRPDMRDAAERMLVWLKSIQFADGSFQGGNVDALPREPVVFNTGQILFGLAAGVTAFGDAHRPSLDAAGAWLLNVQDEDGAWRKFRSPFTSPGPKTYETHVAWALLEADRVSPDHGYADAAIRNIRWAISQQQENGWFDLCCLGDPRTPLTHTIGYVLRGVIEGWRYRQEPDLLQAALKTANALVDIVAADGRLAGRLDSNWDAACDWVCVTGTSQIAHCLLLLYEAVGDARYLATAKRMNRYVRRTVRLDGTPDVVGGVKGSFPTYGGYGPYKFLNWAAKFTIDANLAEAAIKTG